MSDIEVAVMVGRPHRLAARGVGDVLREDGKLSVLITDLDIGGHECALARSSPQVAIVPESTHPAWLRMSRARAIVVLSREPMRAFGVLLLAAGMSCLDVASSEENVVALVRRAAEGRCSFVSADQCIELGTPAEVPLLTQREIDVLVGLSEGKASGEIALRLEISPHTVRKHTRKLVHKLMVQSKRDFAGLPVEWLR
jgi:DNA-binding NarL/FixJ family response regulator